MSRVVGTGSCRVCIQERGAVASDLRRRGHKERLRLEVVTDHTGIEGDCTYVTGMTRRKRSSSVWDWDQGRSYWRKCWYRGFQFQHTPHSTLYNKVPDGLTIHSDGSLRYDNQSLSSYWSWKPHRSETSHLRSVSPTGVHRTDEGEVRS